MCAFPTADLDNSRELLKTMQALREKMRSPILRAAGAQSLLMIPTAGIGKTHALVSAAHRRLMKGALSLVMLGEDFESAEPWEVIRRKLGLGSNVGRDELFALSSGWS